MFRATLILCMFAPGLYAHDADCAWAWAKAKAGEKDDVQSAWEWSKAKGTRPCYCGKECKCKECSGEDCKCKQSECYTSLIGRAIAEQKPLVIAVDYEPPVIEGFLRCRYDGFKQVSQVKIDKPTLIIARPVGKSLEVAARMSPQATADQIRAAVAPVVQPVPASR